MGLAFGGGGEGGGGLGDLGGGGEGEVGGGGAPAVPETEMVRLYAPEEVYLRQETHAAVRFCSQFPVSWSLCERQGSMQKKLKNPKNAANMFSLRGHSVLTHGE